MMKVVVVAKQLWQAANCLVIADVNILLQMCLSGIVDVLVNLGRKKTTGFNLPTSFLFFIQFWCLHLHSKACILNGRESINQRRHKFECWVFHWCRHYLHPAKFKGLNSFWKCSLFVSQNKQATRPHYSQTEMVVRNLKHKKKPSWWGQDELKLEERKTKGGEE